MSYDPSPMPDLWDLEEDGENALELIRAVHLREVILSAAFKTVDIFSGITGKRLILKNGDQPSTDLHTILAPFDGPYFYQDVEHELSHILFRSDSIAKKLFIEEYVKRVTKLVEKQGITFDAHQKQVLTLSVNHLIGVTEDRRCESLWSLIYGGSYRIMREQAYEFMERGLSEAHRSLCVYYSLIEAGHSPKKGKLSRYRPYFEEALKKVEYRGFEATLVVSKWLLANLVSELIREIKKLPSPPPPQKNSAGGGAQESGGDGNDGEGQQQTLWDPPEVDATPEERAEALKKLLVYMGTIPGDIADRADDVKAAPFQEPGAGRRAAKAVSDALKLDIHNPSEVNACLDGSESKMRAILAEVFAFLRQRMTGDEWIRRGTEAKVVFRDVRERDTLGRTPAPLDPEDVDTIRRLRAIFHRVMGKRHTVLDDTGTDLDVAAYIERRLTGNSTPVFRQDVRGRGFKCLLVIDRSGSMSGHRTRQAERACRVIARALKFPFVDMNMWGFQSLEDGQIDITRFDPRLEIFDSDKSSVRGFTPLHLAVRVGVRHMERGSEAKHLVVVTDGVPVYYRRDGESYPTAQLLSMVREEVRKARKKGIQVTGLLIGHELDSKSMAFMFGRSWKYLPSEHFGPPLVQVISTSFMNYLRRG